MVWNFKFRLAKMTLDEAANKILELEVGYDIGKRILLRRWCEIDRVELESG